MAESLRLFLIEDEDDVALLIRRTLERAGHSVTCCRTASDALIVLGQSTFDLVLLDQNLPDMPGLDLLGRLTREGIAVPVLVVTAYGDEHLVTRALHAGALDYIAKDNACTFLVELPKRVLESVTRHRLKQLNSLLIQSLESARDGILITDLQGVILHVNRSLEQLTGYRREELIGQTPRIFKSGNHPPEFYAEMWRVILARSSWQGELTNRRKDGRPCQVSMTISPIVDEQGRLTHFVGIQRDITAQKSLERQLLQAQKMQSVGTLAGGVAHEFNNLLAGINGYASLGLREPDLSPEVREFFDHIVALSERAAALTRQLLAFARKPALVRQKISPIDLLHSTAELVRRTLRQEVVLELPAPGRGREALLVEADANQLQQALVNLALNARDAILEKQARRTLGPGPLSSPFAARPRNGLRDAFLEGSHPAEGGDRLRGQGPGKTVLLGGGPDPGARAGVEPEDAVVFRLQAVLLAQEQPGFPQRVPPGDYVVLEVRDCGVGMAPDVLTQSVDPFFTTKEVGQGTGLGLPMVFGIVQGHHGYLTIESTTGAGTNVSLWLPRMVERPETQGASLRGSASVEVGEPESAGGRAILVIDDEEAVLDVVRRFLQIAGHRVLCATTGQEGVELLGRNQGIDLVILDLMMPREDPVATFHHLRQRNASVPVLLCTGLAETQPVPDLLRGGAAGLLRKPFRMNELWYAVRQALARK